MALVALPEVLGSIPSTHVAIHNCPTLDPGAMMPSSGLSGHCTHSIQTHPVTTHIHMKFYIQHPPLSSQ